ncbi:hypothetical protein LEP1GSC172_0741 [Leptospira noguchii]|uniref:Uncharacterized protein n=2 Tax=Leptospira noguchii TaxID=28182 RepID=T0GP36_9LEPT|nr:hypothetical protein LEP1GSC172_0741 [Leptospira noguchii]EQA70642.1 hypothetical protein LEP1GSC059_4592 [Leptospira noguchii serovar Panama str. CZ214]
MFYRNTKKDFKTVRPPGSQLWSINFKTFGKSKCHESQIY